MTFLRRLTLAACYQLAQSVLKMCHSMSNQLQKKFLTLTDLNETWFLHSICEVLTHSEFQHSAMYGLELELIFRKFLAYLLLLNQP